MPIFRKKKINSSLPYSFPAGFGVGPRLRSGAMKAPVGLLSGSAVCDSRWRGIAPTSTPNKSTSETRRSLRSEVPDGPSSTRGKESSASVGGSFCFAGALRDGVVYSSWFNKQKFIYKGEY